jgi:EmrB/QacA subfamily drug resistance transporter
MRGRGLILATLCLAALIINLDTTIVNVALPALVRQLGATTTGLQWVVDAYNLVFAALILAAGSLSDRLGRKGMLLAGLGVFGAASLAGAFATSVGQLVGARAVMGLGAALMFPSTLSLLTNVFSERRERALAIGVWGASAGVGIALGPIVGGWLLERFWWGSIFLFFVPVAAVVAALVAWRVPTSRDPRTPPLDWRGLVLSAAGMSLIVYGIIQAPGWGWASAAAIGTLAAGVAVLGLLVAAELRTAHQMIDMGLFRNPRFTAASASVAIAFFALLGFIFLMTLYFQVVRGYSPLSTGVRLLPVAVSVGVASVVGTRLAVRAGNKIIVGGGLALFSAALAWIAATASQTTPYPVIAAQMVVLGTGMGLGGQRLDPAVRRHPRRGGDRQRRRVPVHQPAGRAAAPRPPRSCRDRRQRVGRRRRHRRQPPRPRREARPRPRPRPGRRGRVPAQPHRRQPGRRRSCRCRGRAGGTLAPRPPPRRAGRSQASRRDTTRSGPAPLRANSRALTARPPHRPRAGRTPSTSACPGTRFDLISNGLGVKLRVPHDLPEMAVGVAEVPGVNAPGPVVWLVSQRGARLLGPAQQCVHICLTCHGVADAEFASLRWAQRDVRVLRQLRARVQGQDKSALQLEHYDRSGRVGVVTGELCASDAR